VVNPVAAGVAGVTGMTPTVITTSALVWAAVGSAALS
jgi:hypothetical protein